MLRKIILGIVAFALISVGVQAGVGILDSSKQADFTISCPEGAANCSEILTEAEDYSVSGTQDFVLRLLGGILNFAAIIAVLMLVIVGARLVIAMGNQEDLQAAKKQLLWTFGGLAVIILSLLIVRNITEKIYEAAQDCLSVAEDGIYSEKTKQAKGEAPKVAESWNQGSWNLDEKTFDDNIFGFQKAFNQLECGGAEKSWKRVDTEATIDCLTLDEDGKHGSNTETARNEAPNLATKHGVDNYTHQEWIKYKQVLTNVEDFQKEFNGLDCDDKTGKKKDIEKGSKLVSQAKPIVKQPDNSTPGGPKKVCDKVDNAKTIEASPNCEVTCDDGYEVSADGMSCEESAVEECAEVTNATTIGDYPGCEVTACDDGYDVSEDGMSCVDAAQGVCGTGEEVCEADITIACEDVPVGKDMMVYFDGTTSCKNDCSGWNKLVDCSFDSGDAIASAMTYELLVDEGLTVLGSPLTWNFDSDGNASFELTVQCALLFNNNGQYSTGPEVTGSAEGTYLISVISAAVESCVAAASN